MASLEAYRLPSHWPAYPISVIVIAVLLFNGVVLARSPELWVRSRWTLKGPYRPEDLEESESLGTQLRIVGFMFLFAGGLVVFDVAVTACSFTAGRGVSNTAVYFALQAVLAGAGLQAIIRPTFYLRTAGSNSDSPGRRFAVRLGGILLLVLVVVRVFGLAS